MWAGRPRSLRGAGFGLENWVLFHGLIPQVFSPRWICAGNWELAALLANALLKQSCNLLPTPHPTRAIHMPSGQSGFQGITLTIFLKLIIEMQQFQQPIDADFPRRILAGNDQPQAGGGHLGAGREEIWTGGQEVPDPKKKRMSC